MRVVSNLVSHKDVLIPEYVNRKGCNDHEDDGRHNIDTMRGQHTERMTKKSGSEEERSGKGSTSQTIGIYSGRIDYVVETDREPGLTETCPSVISHHAIR